MQDAAAANCRLGGRGIPLKERRIASVKNPAAGKIQADSIGQIILENSVVENHCEIITNQTEAKV